MSLLRWKANVLIAMFRASFSVSDFFHATRIRPQPRVVGTNAVIVANANLSACEFVIRGRRQNPAELTFESYELNLLPAESAIKGDEEQACTL